MLISNAVTLIVLYTYFIILIFCWSIALFYKPNNILNLTNTILILISEFSLIHVWHCFGYVCSENVSLCIMLCDSGVKTEVMSPKYECETLV